jgi:hypothetical protein
MIYRDEVAGNRLFRNTGSALQAKLECRVTQKITTRIFVIVKNFNANSCFSNLCHPRYCFLINKHDASLYKYVIEVFVKITNTFS